jgi:sulfide dehydrogenase [flavocytochrome c] flavoprotein chain
MASPSDSPFSHGDRKTETPPRRPPANRWTRREISGLAAALFAPHVARSQSRPKVLVIGGGVGGATLAKSLTDGVPLDVTVIEPRRAYTTCFFSNQYLAGMRTFSQLTHSYDALVRRPGVTMIHDVATMIDLANRTVRLGSGATLSYDRLAMAPGSTIRDDAIEGYDAAAMKIMPHAWKTGEQTRTLRRQLESMADGGLFVMVAPPDPFPCPPAPYERVSLIAA